MQTNNLTRPTEDQEIMEIVAFMDADASRMNFTDNFANIHFGGNRGYNIYEYIDNGNLPDTVNFTSDLYDLNKVTQKEARNALWLHYDDKCSDKWRELFSKHVRMRDFLEQYNYSWELAFDWKDALVDTLDQDFTIKEAINDEVGLIRFCDNYQSNYHVYSTSGCSQGDYAMVVVNIAEIERMSGRKFDNEFQNRLQKEINQSLWGCPVYVRFQFGDEDLNLDEYLKDQYEWEKDEVMEGVKAKLDLPKYAIDFLEENLPTYIEDYV
jgi:hypothetical protein